MRRAFRLWPHPLEVTAALISTSIRKPGKCYFGGTPERRLARITGEIAGIAHDRRTRALRFGL
jgi:hypothetical protein